MRVSINTWLIAALVLSVSCSKEAEPEQLPERPDFYLQGELNGTPYYAAAGDSSYLFTSFDLDSGNLPVFSGTLEFDQEAGDASWEISIRGHRASQTVTAAYLDSALFQDAYTTTNANAVVPSANLRVVKFLPDASGPVFQYFWSFHNGSSFSYLTSPELEVDLRQDSMVNASLTVLHSNGCSANSNHQINVVDTASCRGSFHCTSLGGYSFNAQASAWIGSLSQVEWYLDGTHIGSGINHTFYIATNGLHTVEARMSFVNGCTYTMTRDLLVQAGGTYAGENCPIDFNYQIQPVLEPDSLQAGTLDMAYTDATGKRFTTARNSSAFEVTITNWTPYQPNHLGQATYRFKLTFSGQLTAADGSVVTVNNLTGYWAVAVP